MVTKKVWYSGADQRLARFLRIDLGEGPVEITDTLAEEYFKLTLENEKLTDRLKQADLRIQALVIALGALLILWLAVVCIGVALWMMPA